MRHAVISDIHGNLTALKAVFDDLADRGPVDSVWCLGDIVGYGPDPNECVELLRDFDLRAVVGNHDTASIGELDLRQFNPEARWACEWTGSQLASENLEFLASLPLADREGDYTLVHGSPRNPVWEYIMSPSQAKANLHHCSTRHCMVGHTHVPALYLWNEENDICSAEAMPTEQWLAIGRSPGRLLINPGSVGQPRDRDPRASYVLLDDDTSTFTHLRVAYDVEAVQERMRRHGMPPMLIERLGFGW